MIAQLRDSAKSRWEAVKTYYSERDVPSLVTINGAIHHGTWTEAATYFNFYEKWGRLAKLGYLPTEIFDGSSCVSMSNAALRIKPFLIERRGRNLRYASCYLWLVKEVNDKGFLADAVSDTDLSLLWHDLNEASHLPSAGSTTSKNADVEQARSG